MIKFKYPETGSLIRCRIKSKTPTAATNGASKSSILGNGLKALATPNPNAESNTMNLATL
ncbi:hypothetical protein [Xenorhabdus bovienii]|uniref:hypothetical protein n=1 Tax=Xenorhabdus bovienii TaxID=40576 RepID=UPI0018AFA5BF|nr:hypothetical protein [Xenorhabdus bovienii]